MRRLATVACLAVMCVAGGLLLGHAQAADEEEAKLTIKDVMERAHKSKLLNKVAAGEGTEEEAKQLAALYKALEENKPPKGDAEGWKKKTVAIVKAAQEVVEGKEGAGRKLTMAANCANCHKEHKP
jgi:23S rRNA U2552 (ribose-2'-O)-methylase RlmE/FtsJ